ncbi:unnamed protein product [Allacma fusca]|uniref:C2H2-type domain-containing protein n=1 Tax=Allacma fusca TaxID=39272 RepID=A0A8J2NYA7_9HEXA|nr:unnamed protein product [Allacma fusca]
MVKVVAQHCHLSHSKARPRHKLIKRNKKKAAESPTFPEDSAEFNDSTTNSHSKRIRNWKKESWIEKAKTDPSRTCDLCGKSFIFPAVMKRHKKIVHQGLKPYECTSCGKRFTQKVILNKHTCDFSKEAGNRDILQMNREDQLRKFICSVCGKRFKYPTHLNLHEMNHREERPYPCQQCDKTFRRPDHLKYHVRIVHVDEKKFICTKCGQTFKSISSLRAHEKKHTSDQGHLCNICGKSIKSMYQMSRHKKTHQDELPFECPVCKKRFKMKDYLGQHLRRGKTCSKKLPGFKDNTSNSNNSSVATLPQSIVVQNIPIISESDVIIRRDTVPSNSDCRNYGPVTSELVTLEFSSCFPVDDRLLTEL